MYDKIELHELVEVMLSTGATLEGEVVAKDSEWLTICTSESNEPWCVARKAIVAFSTYS